ncbi:hypothetical protein ONS95_011310 [Cadophora gregata]|uniref:uncharacterized protein n=1 Tax=Cadophora gregata TaxID=51156 RepID=UPI0026DB1C0C|nr:uncharacterized protein ONS95_011310 [Cadophora gregata]KAK0119880.1 hypothetical protein ONS95_011310 [Cadophora gregata]KAK0120916.1 hypothetical protein ONS96_011113 [Cadophora gregata f. sp. sojae]
MEFTSNLQKMVNPPPNASENAGHEVANKAEAEKRKRDEEELQRFRKEEEERERKEDGVER